MKLLLPMVVFMTTATAATVQHALFVRQSAIPDGKSRVTRQAPAITSADQMVQNILQWLQGVYAQNSRKIRQGTFREYLPPTNTQKPRPFEPNTGGNGAATEDNFIGYPPSGLSPNPPFTENGNINNNEAYVPPKTPYPTQQPSGFTSSNQPGGGGGGGGGYPPSGFTPQPPFEGYPPATPPETPGTNPPDTPATQAPPTYSPPTQPPATRPPATYPPATHSPSSYPPPTQPPATYPPPTQPPATQSPPTQAPPTPPPPTYPPATHPPTTYPPATQTPQTYPPPTQPPSTNPPQTYPPPTNPPGETPYPPATQPPQTPPPQTPPPLTHTPSYPTQPPTTYPPPGHIISTTEPPFTSEPQTPADHHGSDAPTTNDLTLPPGQSQTTDSNVITSPGDNEPSGTDEDEDLKHPPHIHAIDVECAKDMMTINIEFNRKFDGVIYSKGYYNNPDCRYVKENSGQTKYSFTVSLNNCGTEFINAFDTQGQSYLENVLVLQNEAGIQEVWDTIRSVRCLWEGNLNKALSVALSVGMLTQEIVTFSGDTAMAKLDIQLGRGPFAQPANGLVKIGDVMTLVVSVTGDPGFDIQVKDCRAKDSEGEHSVALTDENGCVLKPKLFGAFQKTRNTGNTGASIIAYAFFNAFKFPDVMDLMIECNVELCKTDCEMCPDPDQKLEPGRRRRRDVNDTLPSIGEPVLMGKTLRVILPEDLSDGEAIINLNQRQEVCLSTHGFVMSSAILISLLTCSTLFSAYQWHKNQRLMQKY